MSDYLACKCGFKAKNKQALYAHSASHKNGKGLPQKKGLFPCLYCEKIFETQSGLNGHKIIHPSIIGSRATEQHQNESPIEIQESINKNNILKRIREKPEVQQEYEKQKAMLANIKSDFTVIPSNIYNSSIDMQDIIIKDIPSCECIDDCIPGKCPLADDLMECHPGTCTASQCKNNAISLAKTQSTYVKGTRDIGLGLFAKNDIPADTFICEYIGEFVDKKAAQKRSSFFTMSVQFSFGGILGYIDSQHFGNGSVFINHSCSSNCRYEIWVADNLPRIAVYSRQQIARDDELTCYYGPPYEKGIVCLCGAENCQKRLPF